MTSLIMLRAVLATAAAIAGGFIILAIRDINHRLLCAMVSLAAGALLAVASVEILPEAAELSGWMATGISTVIGLTIFYIIGKYVYFLCPACAASAVSADKGYLRLGILMIVAMTLHSLTDGLALALGHEKLAGVLILIAVSYHKVPEGLALTSVSMMAGYKKWHALGITVLVELTTTLGAFIGLLINHYVKGAWVGIVLAHVAGGFLYIVLFALVQEMREHEKKSIMFYSVTGFLSIIVLAQLLRPIVGR